MGANGIGAKNVFDAAAVNALKRVVVLRIDKAIYPIDAMKIYKAIAGKVVVARLHTHRKGEKGYCATRYGNLMVTRASVMPMRVSQINADKLFKVIYPNILAF